MTAIDATELHAIEHLSNALPRSGRSLPRCGTRDQPARMMERAEFHEHVGSENLLPPEAALARARLLIGSPSRDLDYPGQGDDPRLRQETRTIGTSTDLVCPLRSGGDSTPALHRAIARGCVRRV